MMTKVYLTYPNIYPFQPIKRAGTSSEVPYTSG